MNYKKVNNLFGWFVFAISFIVYLLTMEPTVSFWDCGEFLSVAYKLQVGHSPGAPLFMMLGRIWSLFASSPAKVAVCINSLSALMSGLTIMFLFWSITYFAKKIVVVAGTQPTGIDRVKIIGAGVIGALAYTFSDTFWFSAVEAEVYASSSFFTAIVFWAVLKWEEHADEPDGDRWLILISYLMGLSTGVHLLNLLTIPALAMVYYFKRNTISVKGIVTSFIVGCGLLGIVQFGIIQGLPYLASKMELLFVNKFKLSFDSGAYFFIFILVLIFAYLLFWTKRKNKYFANLVTLCILFVVMGYSSYVTTIIRSRANVSIDMANPDNMMSLVSYLARDQYGQQPIFSGPYYNSVPDDITPGSDIYRPEVVDGQDHYAVVGTSQASYHYAGDQKHIFPRLWSAAPNHAQFYMNYLGLSSKDEEPTGSDNMGFFLKYQTNWMWWRYFMWNFAGRENDYQGSGFGEAQSGNWVSGLSPVDKMFGRGNLNSLPESYKINGARNYLYLLPLLLGVAGIIVQIKKDKSNAFIVGLLFFFTGWAIVIYLNNTPLQPRERDYAYAGATYAFAIWIGLGVIWLIQVLEKKVKNSAIAYIAIACTFILVPVLMATQEWNDHDRSQKTLAQSTAFNTLMSCDSNAILFTFGDNDTYPVWYLQEIEGIRRDVRVINTSLLGIDWYIDQLRYKVNDADAVPMTWKPSQYIANKNNFVKYKQNAQLADKYTNLEEVLNFVFSDNPQNQVVGGGDTINVMPTINFSIPVDKQAIAAQKVIPAYLQDRVVDTINFTAPQDLDKSSLAMLSIIAAVTKDGWKRPIYFSAAFPGGGDYQGLDAYTMAEGVVNKLVPLTEKDFGPGIGQPQLVNLDKSFQLFTQTYLWGGGEKKNVYFDEKNRAMMETYRVTSVKVANALSLAGRKADALKVLDAVYNGITYESDPYDQLSTLLCDGYYKAGNKDRAQTIANIIVRDNTQMMQYFSTLSEDNKALAMKQEARSLLGSLNMLAQIAQENNDIPNQQKITKLLNSYYQEINSVTGGSLGN